MHSIAFYPRYIQQRLKDALEDSPVVLIHGPRQCGKTTRAQTVCAPGNPSWNNDSTKRKYRTASPADDKFGEYTYISFDNKGPRELAKNDPVGFASALPQRVILDEVQKVPELFEALKIEVDRNRVPGRFLLTGSANVLQVPGLSDSLAGRMLMIRLHPLAQCELENQPPPGFLDTLFENGFKVCQTRRLGMELGERISAGGYPAALALPPGQRRFGWYDSYIMTQLLKDVSGFARISTLETLPQLLAIAATRTAGLFNVSDITSSFELSRHTVKSYIKLLEMAFLLERIPPWYSNLNRRLVKTPKLHMCDTGLACTLLGVDADGLVQNRPLLGQLLETFVLQELRRQASWHNAHLSFYHYRDRKGAEVDIVIERGALAVAGIEVKAAGTVTKADFRGLSKLEKTVGRRFVCGAVLYDGNTCLRYGDRMWAIPLRMLWENPQA